MRILSEKELKNYNSVRATLKDMAKTLKCSEVHVYDKVIKVIEENDKLKASIDDIRKNNTKLE
jgi:septal ring factor EnvC (AmiA/AmiB activator)